MCVCECECVCVCVCTGGFWVCECVCVSALVVAVCVCAGGGYVCVCVCEGEREGDTAEGGKVGSFRFHEIHFNHPLQSTTLCNYKALMLKYKKTHQERDIKLASGNMKIHETHN